MKILAGVLVGATLLVVTLSQTQGGLAAPAFQLPWPSGVSHRIYGGSTYGCGYHIGAGYFAIDFALARYDDVAAVAAGKVSFVGDSGGAGGYMIEIDHGGGLKSRYLHLDSSIPGLENGDPVSRGQVIGDAGISGNVPAHLHFDVKLADGAFKAERMSNTGGFNQYSFGWYGYSQESSLNPPSRGCIEPGTPAWYANGCTTTTCGAVHDPSPSWSASQVIWNGWNNWGNVAGGSPVAISYSGSRSDFIWVVKRSGSDIYEHHWNGSAWVPSATTWANISSGGSDPTFNGSVAISNRYSQVTVIATANNLMWVKTWNGSSWSTWSNISHNGPITGSISVSNGPGGRVDVVGVASNTVWWQYFDGSWHGWYDMSNGSPITGEVAVANRGSYVHVAGIASSQAWLKWWKYDGSQANGWYGLGGPIDGSLAIDNMNATPNDPGSPYYAPCPRCGVDIVALAGGSAWLRCWDVDCYQTGWNLLGGPLVGPLTISNEHLQIHVVGRDSANFLWVKWWG